MTNQEQFIELHIKENNTKSYDFTIICKGSGDIVASSAVSHGKKLVLTDREPPGSLYMNLGFIPTKKLTYVADKVAEIQEDSKFRIHAKIKDIDFSSIMNRMRKAEK